MYNGKGIECDVKPVNQARSPEGKEERRRKEEEEGVGMKREGKLKRLDQHGLIYMEGSKEGDPILVRGSDVWDQGDCQILFWMGIVACG